MIKRKAELNLFVHLLGAVDPLEFRWKNRVVSSMGKAEARGDGMYPSPWRGGGCPTLRVTRALPAAAPRGLGSVELSEVGTETDPHRHLREAAQEYTVLYFFPT